jgi:hypothetical protein
VHTARARPPARKFRQEPSCPEFKRGCDGVGRLAAVLHPCRASVELRGFEPLAFPGEMTSELRQMFFGGVTQVSRVLRICVGVLRDVTVLAALPRSLSMSLRLGLAPGLVRLERAGQLRSAVRSITRDSTESRRFRRVSFTNPFTNLAALSFGRRHLRNTRRRRMTCSM